MEHVFPRGCGGAVWSSRGGIPWCSYGVKSFEFGIFVLDLGVRSLSGTTFSKCACPLIKAHRESRFETTQGPDSGTQSSPLRNGCT